MNKKNEIMAVLMTTALTFATILPVYAADQNSSSNDVSTESVSEEYSLDDQVDTINNAVEATIREEELEEEYVREQQALAEEEAKAQMVEDAKKIAEEKAEAEAKAKAEAKKNSVKSNLLYTPDEFMSMGAVDYNGYHFTYYSELVLPGEGLDIPGRHDDEQGYVCDSDGYICVASCDFEKGTVVDTPFGKKGKVYDYCPTSGTIDIYVAW